MSKKPNLKPIAAALGTGFVVSLAAVSITSAAENPFVMTELGSGYMVAGDEGYCGANVKDTDSTPDSGGNRDHRPDANAGATNTGDANAGKDAHEDDSGANQKVVSKPVKADREGNCGGKQ